MPKNVENLFQMHTKDEASNLLYEQWADAFIKVDIPILADDLCCRLLAIVYVYGGSMECFTHNQKLYKDVRYAQKKLNIGGGLVPDKELGDKLRTYIKEIENHIEHAEKDENKQSPFSVKHLDWCVKIMKERYNEPLWI